MAGGGERRQKVKVPVSLRGLDRDSVILKGIRISSLLENKVSYRTVVNCVFTLNYHFYRVLKYYLRKYMDCKTLFFAMFVTSG